MTFRDPDDECGCEEHKAFQPYFVAYCAFLGRSPEGVIRDFRGHEYIAWIERRWREWDLLVYDGKPPLYRSDHERAQFGAWLRQHPQAPTAASAEAPAHHNEPHPEKSNPGGEN